MAEAVGLRNNALPYPIYAQPWGVVFPMLDADGDLVTGATTPDAERSLNGDTFADCTNESTEIATTSGVYYLLLTAAEMTADVVAVIAKSASAGMKTTVLTFYPRKLVTLRTGTAAGGAAGSITLDASASAVDDFYNGCVVAGVLDSTNEVRTITDYVGSTKVASVTPNWNVTPDSDDTFTIYLPEGRQLNEANVTTWRGTAAPSEHTAGYPIVTIKDGTGTGEINTNAGAVALVDVTTTLTNPVTLANGAHGGTSATLRLGGSTSTPAFYVTNSGGQAGRFESTGGDGSGLRIVGNGTGVGLDVEAGATGQAAAYFWGPGGHGLMAESGGAGFVGILGQGSGTDSPGIQGDGNGAGSGIQATGGATGHGMQLLGGATSGDGLHCEAIAGDGHGMSLAGNGAGLGLYSKGGLSGDGGSFEGGDTAGNGLSCVAAAASGSGIFCIGFGSGAGLSTIGGGTGHGILAVGGATSGDGLHAQATAGNGDGIQAVKHGSGQDINATLLSVLTAENVTTTYLKNTAVVKFSFPMLTTAGAPGTGLTITGEISQDGGAFAGITDTVTEISDGWYEVDLTNTEMNADEIGLKFTATGARQLNIKLRTQSV